MRVTGNLRLVPKPQEEGCRRVDSRRLLSAASTEAVQGPGEHTPNALFSCSSEMNICRAERTSGPAHSASNH